MNKKLILGLALAVLLVSGSMVTAQAECNFCLPHISMPTFCGACAARVEEPIRDRDCAGNLITPNGVYGTGVGW